MERLLKILSKIPDASEWQHAEVKRLERLLQLNKEQIVIYGHGNLGSNITESLEKMGLRVSWYIDANYRTDPQNRIVNLQDAALYIPENSLIIIAIYDLFRSEAIIKEELHKHGFSHILSAAELRAIPDFFQYGVLNWQADRMNVSALQETYALLEDEKSRRCFIDLLEYSLAEAPAAFKCDPLENQYMPTDVYRPSAREHIIDCGAYNGDTMRSFATRIGGWASYTGIEPDPQNGEAFMKSVQKDIPEELQGKCRLLPMGGSDHNGTASFEVFGTSCTRLATEMDKKAGGNSTVSIKIGRLDDMIQSPVSFIKMDIEGLELSALRGAEMIIRKNQPLMAICGYHNQSDFWEIPLFLKKVLPNHRIFLRNYVGLIEYVYYAVPVERML